MSGKILIIEDEKRLRSNLQLLLQSEGYTVSAAADGREGITCLQQEPYDVVITDIMMEGVNGFQVMEYIAANTPETMVIVITGYASTESATEALRKGAYDYIAKPFEVEMVLFSLERALEKVRLQREVTRHTEELEARVAERTKALAEMNQKLEHSLVELKSAQEQLIQTEKLSALGELISGFAHEINNPLTSVVGYAELLAESEDCPPDVCSGLEKICQEAVRCHHIVQNLLSFARKKKPEKDYIDLTTLCLKTIDLLAYQFRVNNITTVTHFAERLPWTMADNHQIQQVLVNILSNAYHAMADYQGKGQLTIATAYDETWLYIKITDTGPGIASENLRRIFNPFYTTKEKGTGLGLSLSYGLIKEHGGEITVTSPAGEGATFTIALPIIDEPVAEGVVSLAPDTQHLPAKKVLVIDDEPHVAQMIAATLWSLGHQADAVFSVREASERLITVMPTQAYDLIICDMKMPEMDGRQMYEFVEGHYPNLLHRMVFSSGDTVSQENQQFLQETGCSFLQKPFLREDFTRLISQVLSADATVSPALPVLA
jgi:two-component system NtrC family sensor kinase